MPSRLSVGSPDGRPFKVDITCDLMGEDESRHAREVVLLRLLPGALQNYEVLLGPREHVKMSFDSAGEDLEFEIPKRVDSHDPGDPRVGVIVTDERMPTNRRFEPRSKVRAPNPQTSVVCHVHEVDLDVIGVRHD